MSGARLEILAWEDTPLGILCLRRRAVPGIAAPVTEITLDHAFLMSSLHTESERALATRAVEIHGGAELRALIGGLGLGYTAAAALDTGRVARVRVVELLQEVIRWMRAGLVPLAARLAAEPRMILEQGDVYAKLASPGAGAHDLVLVDVDHAPEEPLARDAGPVRFHTEAGLARAREHLAPGGVLGVWSSREDAAFERAMERVFPWARSEPVAFRNRHAGSAQIDWLYFGRH